MFLKTSPRVIDCGTFESIMRASGFLANSMSVFKIFDIYSQYQYQNRTVFEHLVPRLKRHHSCGKSLISVLLSNYSQVFYAEAFVTKIGLGIALTWVTEREKSGQI